MKTNNLINTSSNRNACTVQLDTSCVYYRWRSTDDVALNCLGLTSGTDLSTILEEIDNRLCEFAGFNLAGYDLGCLTEAHDIYSFQQFAEAISEEVCTLKNADFGYKLDTLNAYIGMVNKPSLQDSCIGFVQGDSVQTIFQKLFDKVCELDKRKIPTVSSPDIKILESKTVDLTTCDEKGHTLKAEVKLSPLSDNRAKALDSGLYVPSLSDADIGALLDRINSVPALKEKLCNICSFNQGVGGLTKCSCTLKIDSVARYNGNNYSVVINTVNLGIAPYYWEVRNNINVIVASGNTTSTSALIETFRMPDLAVSGQYTIRFTSLTCECSDMRTFTHTAGGNSLVSPIIVNAIQICEEDDYSIVVQTSPGTNPEMTTIIKNSYGEILHTRTNSLTVNTYQITYNGTYTIQVFDSSNSLVSSIPSQIMFTCIGQGEEEPTCVTYFVTNIATSDVTIEYTNCIGDPDTAIIPADSSAVLCMMKNSFAEDNDITFTQISDTCDAVCDFEILDANVEC